jgi:hypothetical protein
LKPELSIITQKAAVVPDTNWNGKETIGLARCSNYAAISFDGLQHGHYKLTVQASNAAGEFNGPEKILSYLYSPPFWVTWWFSGICSCMPGSSFLWINPVAIV